MNSDGLNQPKPARRREKHVCAHAGGLREGFEKLVKSPRHRSPVSPIFAQNPLHFYFFTALGPRWSCAEHMAGVTIPS
jgi:hypothetical protein